MTEGLATDDLVLRTSWRTPRGQEAVFDFRYRPETTDWNTVNSIMGDANNADEYGIADLHLTGWALDIGSHIGGMAIALALDNPELRVIAIEPVPSNVDLLRSNVVLNGLADRITVLAAAAGLDGHCQIAWNWTGVGTDHEEPKRSSLNGHRYIGGSSLALDNPGVPHEEITVRSWSLAALCEEYGISDFAFVKIDCEGCEALFLDSPLVSRIEHIHGEFHPPYIDRAGILRLLGPTHDVEFSEPEAGPAGFTAVRR